MTNEQKAKFAKAVKNHKAKKAIEKLQEIEYSPEMLVGYNVECSKEYDADYLMQMR